MSDEFIHRSHSIGNNVHHIEWCTKYRYRMLASASIRESLKEILQRAAVYYHIKIIEMAIQPEHVHLVVQLHPTMPQSKAVQLLKGFSAYEMFRKHPNMRKRYPRGHLWSRGNFKDSVGGTQKTTSASMCANRKSRCGCQTSHSNQETVGFSPRRMS